MRKYIFLIIYFLVFNELFGQKIKEKPNIIFVFADQLRAQDLGYSGNKDVKTGNIDRLSRHSLNFKYAISCLPVSCPYRASLLTGQYALTNGVFLNDLQLNLYGTTIGKVYKHEGYNTGYIGKWHLNGCGREKYIPCPNRQGFDYFKALECTHDYMNSAYYDNNDTLKKIWKGYDAIAQTKDAVRYIQEMSKGNQPFVLFISFGPPHNPYQEVPDNYKQMYKYKNISLRENVPLNLSNNAINDLRGYYAHISALDDCIGQLMNVVEKSGIENNTIFVFTSDHGDMLYSHGLVKKQKPYDESILVPFLLKYPKAFGKKRKNVKTILSTVDIFPTLLGLSGITIPKSIEGEDLSPILLGNKKDWTEMALIECISPFGEWDKRNAGKEYRGIRTRKYTYVKDLNGPWLLFDNDKDPYQKNNLIGNSKYQDVQRLLEGKLLDLLKRHNDQFLPGYYYIKQRNYKVNRNGTVDY